MTRSIEIPDEANQGIANDNHAERNDLAVARSVLLSVS